jgi:hypothetical protein
MKKILLKVVAILGLVCFSHATTSANIVGYAKINVTAGELQLCALNFTPSSTSVSDLIGNQLDNGSAIYKWDKSTGTYAIYNKGGRGWPSTATLELGDAFWIDPTNTGEIILSGDVLTDASVTSTINSGIDATGLYFPVETTMGATDLKDTAGISVVHVWNSDSQTYTTYNKGGRGWPGSFSSQVIGPTDGIWVESTGVSWTESRPFDLDS